MEALCGLKSYIRTTAYTSTAKVAHDFKLGCAAELARFAGLAILRLHSARSDSKMKRACLDVDSDNNHVPVLSFISPDAAFMSLECYRQRTHKMSDPIPASSPGGSQFCHGEGVETLQIKGNRIEGRQIPKSVTPTVLADRASLPTAKCCLLGMRQAHCLAGAIESRTVL